MDEEYHLPIHRLKAASVGGRQFELQAQSWAKVQKFVQEREDGVE